MSLTHIFLSISEIDGSSVKLEISFTTDNIIRF